MLSAVKGAIEEAHGMTVCEAHFGFDKLGALFASPEMVGVCQLERGHAFHTVLLYARSSAGEDACVQRAHLAKCDPPPTPPKPDLAGLLLGMQKQASAPRSPKKFRMAKGSPGSEDSRPELPVVHDGHVVSTKNTFITVEEEPRKASRRVKTLPDDFRVGETKRRDRRSDSGRRERRSRPRRSDSGESFGKTMDFTEYEGPVGFQTMEQWCVWQEQWYAQAAAMQMVAMHGVPVLFGVGPS